MKVLLICLLVVLLCLTLAAMIVDKPYVEKNACVGCEDCVSQCPTGAISIVNERATIDPEQCIDCKFCVRACTYKAIRSPK